VEASHCGSFHHNQGSFEIDLSDIEVLALWIADSLSLGIEDSTQKSFLFWMALLDKSVGAEDFLEQDCCAGETLRNDRNKIGLILAGFA
jgi:hypothetical protein